MRSPHVVQVLDQGVEERTSAPFLVMELLEGETLRQRLRRSGRLSLRETVELLEQAGRALSFAHARRIVHRDVKPSNIFIALSGEQEVVKVLDFGVAKPISKLEQALTEAGSVLGTPAYMSPEQARGGAVDHRADVWSLAVIACECVTGCSPFEGGDFAEVLERVLNAGKRPPPSWLEPAPEGFDAWFARATCPNIAERFQSVKELLAGLAQLERGRERSSARGSARLERDATLVLPRRQGSLGGTVRDGDGERPPVLSGRAAGALIVALGMAGAIGWRSTGHGEHRAPGPTASELATLAFRQSPGQPPLASAEQWPRENEHLVADQRPSVGVDAGSPSGGDRELKRAAANPRTASEKPRAPRLSPAAAPRSHTARDAVVHPVAPANEAAPKNIIINGHKIWTSLDAPREESR